MTNSITYPANANEFVTPVTMVIRGNHCVVPDTTLAATVGAGNSAHFTSHFDIVVGRGPAAQHLTFTAGRTYVLAADVKAALVAASAPMTVI